MHRPASLEPLETRIAPAALVNPLPDIVAGAGQTSATVELGQMLDALAQSPNHTFVTFTLKLDLDPNTPGYQYDTNLSTPEIEYATVVFELFDDDAPLTVQNFLRYAVATMDPNANANDYAGTFLHRMADFGNTSQTGIDIIQGGGFATTDLDTHIPTYPTLHNEYSAEHPNVRGTIAMGKTALGPDTASSEWFVNTTDNSTILGPTNGNSGGYTVFGQVVSGLQYFDQIALLQKLNASSVGSALGELPVQNYSASAGLKTENLISIEGVKVQSPAARAGATDDLSYTFDITTVDGDSGLLTPTLTGSKLNLAYAAGKSGVVDVTVHVKKQDGQTVETFDDTFRVTVRPNLIANIVSDPLPSILVPGDVVKPVVKITNNGAAKFDGTVNVKFYLSPSTTADSNGFAGDADDILLSKDMFANQTVTLNSDGTATLTGSLTVAAYLQNADTAYRLIAKVEPVTGATELFTDDQYGSEGSIHAYSNGFGVVSIPSLAFNGTNFNFGARLATLSFSEPENVDTDTPDDSNDANNNIVSYSISGAGGGHVFLNDGGINVSIIGTNASSIVNVVAKTAAGESGTALAQIHHLDVANAVGTLNFGQTTIDGYITISNGAKVLNFGDVIGGQISTTNGTTTSAPRERTFLLGPFGALNSTPVTINFGHVKDVNIESYQKITALTATDWLDTAGSAHNTISAPAITKLNVKGDLTADVDVTTTAGLSSFAVAGQLLNSTVSTLGNVGTVSIGSMSGSKFLAGANGNGDFPANRTITSFKITGNTFTNSEVAAANVTSLSIPGHFAGSWKTTGLGTAHLTDDGGQTNLATDGTTATSSIVFTTKASTAIHDVSIDDTLGGFSFSKASVNGAISVANGIKTLTLGNVTGGEQTLHIGAFGGSASTAATLNFARVSNLNLESDQPLAALNAIEWLDDGTTANHIAAPSLAKVNIRGAAAVKNADGTTTPAIAGNFKSDLTLSALTAMSSFVVKGTVSDSTISVPGNVSTVKVGGMDNSQFYAGRDTNGEFVGRHTITSFTASKFKNSEVAASALGTLAIKGVINGTMASSGPGVTHLAQTETTVPAVNLTLQDTDASSSVKFTTSAATKIHNLTVQDSLGSFSFANASVDGLIDFNAGAGSIALGTVAGGEQTMNLGAYSNPDIGASLSFGRVSELNLHADQPISSLKAVEWVDKTGAANVINAPVILALNIRGAAATATTAAVAGDLGADVNLTQATATSSFVVKGVLRDASVTTKSDVGTVSLGGMVNSNFFVGGVTSRPDATGDFTTASLISSFTITTGNFANSQIAAQTITKIAILSVKGDNTGADFGFVADTVGRYVRGNLPAKTNLTTPSVADEVGDYSLTIL